MSDLSPSQRYAQSRRKAQYTETEGFASSREFDLDDFQREACNALESGSSVLVAAPTGAGKTSVAEFAVYLLMRQPVGRLFYTTPIKALSNQKFLELRSQWGVDQVGLLTGDTSVNPHARVVVMTTEVLRNMIYADPAGLNDLSFVVMDEVHYLSDRARGGVWEEVFIHLPKSVTTISLSATVSNAEEFGDWLQSVRGNTSVIVSENRPVPLHQHVLIDGVLLNLFSVHGSSAKAVVNPEVEQRARMKATRAVRGSHHARRRDQFGTQRSTTRVEAIEALAQKGMLPAILFIFSRAGCDQAVVDLARARLFLTTKEERDEILHIADEMCAHLPDEEKDVLNFDMWRRDLGQGLAAHHAGMIPLFKEVVEHLFQKKLLKIVAATETLALGVNMPARTVILEKLEKFNGEARVPLSPGEYTQLTGRAGRRGIDVEGHSVILWNNQLTPAYVATLASKRTYPLKSSFQPSYNMALNLVSTFGADRARDLLQSSFAQFQSDRGVVSLAERVRDNEKSLAGFSGSVACHLGDFESYAALRRELSDSERQDTRGETRKNSRAQQIERLRRAMKAHPCHQCPEREQHARWAERWWRLKRDTDKLKNQIASRTGAISKRFDSICQVLLQLGYLTQTDGILSVSERGHVLARIYSEKDLLICEGLHEDLWSSLDAADLVAMASSVVFESRRDESITPDYRLPQGNFRKVFEDMRRLTREVNDVEVSCGLDSQQSLDAQVAKAMRSWSRGRGLDDVLFEAELTAGDFVRVTKQTIDVLEQLRRVGSPTLSRNAELASTSINRGIVSFAGTVALE